MNNGPLDPNQYLGFGCSGTHYGYAGSSEAKSKEINEAKKRKKGRSKEDWVLNLECCSKATADPILTP